MAQLNLWLPSEAGPLPSDQPALVLIAGHEKKERLALRKAMRADGHRIAESDNGAQAIATCKSSPPDIILLDYAMPDLDGIETCRAIRSLAHCRDIPLLLITGDYGEGLVKKAVDAGVSDYIIKPFLLPLLKQRVRHLLASRRAEQYMQRLAYRDPLTALPNRAYFNERLHELVASAKRSQEHALCYLDLDQFKIVNDTCGHGAGDELLRQVTLAMQACLRQSDTLARLGGDEFGLLLVDCNLDQAVQVAEKLRETVHEFRFTWEEHTFRVGASVGVVAITALSGSAAGLLSAADAACYAAKDQGRNRVVIYYPDNEEIVLRHGEMQWVERINKALEENRVCLNRQEIVPVAARADDGDRFELLSNLVGEDGRAIPPGAFIPAAERYGLMTSIDRWVIVHAFNALQKTYVDNPGRRLKMCFINLSSASLTDESFVSFVRDQFALHRVPHGSVCFEIAEGAAASKLVVIGQVMERLSALGCRFGIDNFGSGVSSFAQIKNLSLDIVKIDGSFVRRIGDSRADYVIVKAINDIAHALNIQTVAEHTQSDEVLQKLREIGVDYAQGDAIALPRPLEEAANCA